MSIKVKLFIALFFLSLLPYAVISFFIFKNEENLLRNNIKNQQIQNLNLVKKNIQEYFLSLKKNLSFWSKAQILDDILINDIDKRIQIFLDQINLNYQIKGFLLVINNKGKVIASTKKTLIGKNFYKFFSSTKESYLIISFPVYASFNRERIGEIIYLQSPKKLKDFLYYNQLSALSVLDTKTGYKIGYITDIPKPVIQKHEYETKDYLYFAKPFHENPLKDWLLISQVNKKIAFLPIIKAQEYFIGIFIVGLIIISIFSFYASHKLVKPLIDIANTMEEVVKNKDYSKRVFYKKRDEIGILTKSFNFMLSEIEKALKTIEEENKKRLELFRNLIEIFSKITSLQNEKEVLDVAVKELKRFLKNVEIQFSENKTSKYAFPIKTENIKGYLNFKTDRNLSEEEVQFFMSIGKLINLLLEKVELLNKAQEASKAKSAFISNMSHELRTPLNSILGFSQFLQTVEEDETKKQALKSIEISGRHLLEMINDILDYAKIEAGAVKVKKEKFSLKQLLEEIKSIIKPLADEKGLKLIFLDTDLQIYTDKKLLKQILLNLLSNAVKFTEKGHIKLSIWEEDKRIFFSVKDTGIGIKKEDLPKLFKNFTQLENPMQKKYKGTGLGLAISKEYVNLLGGEIYAKSQGENKGTEFIFWIEKET